MPIMLYFLLLLEVDYVLPGSHSLCHSDVIRELFLQLSWEGDTTVIQIGNQGILQPVYTCMSGGGGGGGI